MEFPIYQWLVGLASSAFGASLDATARIVSFGFLAACVLPVRAIVRRLGLSPLVLPLFCVFLFTSPTYVYWGRTFMIETAALFFTVAALRHFVDLSFEPENRRSALCFVGFMVLGLLQKITTALPVLVVLFGVFAYLRARAPARESGSRALTMLIDALICFGVPLAIGLVWTLYTDEIKQLNPFGRQLTSAALRSWNLGTLEQRITSPLYRDVIEGRIFHRNLAGKFGLLLIAAALTLRWFTRSAWILWLSLALGLLPLLFFPNLHLVHDYYECGNLIFMLFAAAVALGELLARHMRSLPILCIAVVFIVAQNYRSFADYYLSSVQAVYTDATETEMAIATVIRAQVPPDRVFVAFDFDWSSSLAYLSERKAFMVSPLFKLAEQARVDPTRVVDAATLGAVVACPKSERTLRQLVDWSVHGRRWKIGLVDDCYVAVPERLPPLATIEPAGATCEANAIEVLPVRESAAMRVVRVRVPRASDGPTAASYATGTSPTDLHEMLDVTRRSPRPGIDRGAVPDAEFTRLIDASDQADATLRIYRRTADRLDACRVVETPRGP